MCNDRPPQRVLPRGRKLGNPVGPGRGLIPVEIRTPRVARAEWVGEVTHQIFPPAIGQPVFVEDPLPVVEPAVAHGILPKVACPSSSQRAMYHSRNSNKMGLSAP